MNKIKRILKYERGSIDSSYYGLCLMSSLALIALIFVGIAMFQEATLPANVTGHTYATTDLGRPGVIEILAFTKNNVVKVTQSNQSSETPYVKTGKATIEFISPIDNKKYTGIYVSENTLKTQVGLTADDQLIITSSDGLATILKH